MQLFRDARKPPLKFFSSYRTFSLGLFSRVMKHLHSSKGANPLPNFLSQNQSQYLLLHLALTSPVRGTGPVGLKRKDPHFLYDKVQLSPSIVGFQGTPPLNPGSWSRPRLLLNLKLRHTEVIEI